MMTEPSPNLENSYAGTEEDGITLLDLWRVIWKRRKLIGLLVAAVVLFTVGASLFMTNIYQSAAVIIPITSRDTAGGGALSQLASQFGGSVPGISLPGSSSTTEIVSLLNSNILREKMVERYRLMPVLFHEQWDSRKKDWKHEQSVDLNPLHWFTDRKSSGREGGEGVPQLWDALRLLDDIVKINNNIKENTIDLTVEHEDPELAARLAGYFLDTLTEHMSSEAKRVAMINRTYLEEQLQKTADPLIRQKIYNLIAQQVETAMMAEVKENFAFKVIDPPKVPDRKIKPKRTLMAVLSFFAALFMGVFIAFFMEYLERIKTGGRGEESESMGGKGQ